MFNRGTGPGVGCTIIMRPIISSTISGCHSNIVTKSPDNIYFRQHHGVVVLGFVYGIDVMIHLQNTFAH